MDVAMEQDEQGVDDSENQAPGDKSIEEGAESDSENVEEEDPGEDHEFEIIDQVETEDEDEKDHPGGQDGRGSQDRVNHADKKGEGSGAGSSDSSDEDDDVDDTEIHAMLEKGINKNSIRKREEPTEGKPVIKHKTVLRELETDPFDILPEGWIFVTHNCGMPIYLHKESRVCTMARPYALGTASTRTHNIPISAIPCLMYRKQLDKISQKENETVQSTVPEDCSSRRQGDKLVCQATQDSTPVNGPVVTACPFSSSPACTSSGPQESRQNSVLVTEESTCQGGAHEAMLSKEVLHTGKDEFRMINQESIELENIAVNAVNNDVPGEPASCGNETVSGDLMQCVTEESCASKVLIESKLETTRSFEESSLQDAAGNSVEEGEIIDDSSSSEKECLRPNSRSVVMPQQESGFHTATLDSAPSRQAQSQELAQSKTLEELQKPLLNGEKRLEDPQAHVVREEEGSGNKEQSELVTSSSNSLANLKRRLESLRNRHGGKQRRLENSSRGASSSAVGWPVENNVAVSSLQFDHANPAVSASSNETLKANAAAVKIKCADERARESLLDSKAVQSYCSKLFQFKVIEVKKYSTWKERRKHMEQKYRRNRPELPTSTKLITCPMPGGKPEPGGVCPGKREFVLNPTGKSYLCILHEYMQRTLKIQPLYVFKELENSKTPYGATVTINNIEYGTGYASSKKIAKQEAAKETLKILMPDLFNKISDQEIKHNISDLSFFDNVKVSDSRILELGNKVGQPNPFEILQGCLRRNFGMGNTQCDISTKPLKNQKCEYSIKVGKHTATVVARNKRDGKQQAAQAILAKLHPHVPSWGSLLRLYGTSVEKPVQKPEEINDVKGHAPNHSVLASLREEMRKLHRQKEAIQVKGKIIISSKDLPNKTVGVDL